MTTRLLYYNAFICKDGKKTDFPISVFLDYLMTSKTPENRYKDLKNGSYTMNKMRPPNQEKETNNRSVWVGKYREKKPFSGQRKTDIVNPIAGDVFEPATCLFIHSSHLLVMEYNHIGCKDKGLVEYFNSFLHNSDGLDKDSPQWTFELEPLKDGKGLDVVSHSSQIKALSIDFLTKNSFLNELVKDDAQNKGIIEELVGNTINVAKKVGANITTLSLKQSRFKGKMDIDILTALLASLDLSSEGIVSVKVTYKNSDTMKTELIDLKHEGLLSDSILEGDNSNGFEYIATNVSEYYYGIGGKKGYNHHSKFDIIHVSSNTSIFQ